MGCDIHGVIQGKKNGKWKTLGEGYDDRNYNAFAILANVRNGSGFAGIVTGDGFKPISEPKGFPTDFNIIDEHHPDHKKVYCDDEVCEEGIWMGDHSYSYVSVKELLSVKWDTISIGTGVLELDEYNKWDHGGSPNNYCGGVMGKNIITLEEEEYLTLKRGRKLPKHREICIQVSWDRTYKDAVGKDFMHFVDSLAKLSDKYDDIRFVFGFDN